MDDSASRVILQLNSDPMESPDRNQSSPSPSQQQQHHPPPAISGTRHPQGVTSLDYLTIEHPHTTAHGTGSSGADPLAVNTSSATNAHSPGPPVTSGRLTPRLSRQPSVHTSYAVIDPRSSMMHQSKSRISLDVNQLQRQDSVFPDIPTENPGFCSFLLTVVSVIFIIIFLPFSLFICVKVVQEYERAVIFRLGRLVKGGAKGPGIFFIIPCIDTYCKVDLRTVSFDVPPQEILSKDSVTVAVDAVVYFRISNATVSVSNVEDYARSTRLLAATTLRNVLGTKNLSEILSERESISREMQLSLDAATDPWGVKVERVEIKGVCLPVQLQRAMAAEAEATREARAKVIAAEGEELASRALRDASEVISASPVALQLRYLQTLGSIATEKNSTIVFPIPLELFKGYFHGESLRSPV